MRFLRAPQALAVFILLGSVSSALATNYYVNSASGNNSNAGTSSGAAWLDFTNLNSRTFAAGDNIYLACGSSWNQELDLHGSGAAGSPITLTSYGTGARPIISRNSALTDRTIEMTNPSYWVVSNLEISHANMGLEATYSGFGNNSLTLDHLYIHDIALDMDGSPSGTGSVFYSTGIMINFGSTAPTSSQYTLSGLTISNCEIATTTAPFILGTSYVVGTFTPYSFRNVVVKDNNIHDARGPLSMAFTTGGIMLNTIVKNIGTDHASQGTTALFNSNSESVSYINNYVNGIPATSSADETAIDLEAFDNNTKIYGNFLASTAGPAIELLFINDGIYESGSADYNTNITIAGNTFQNNSNPGSNWGNCTLAAGGGRSSDTYNQTGALTNNLWFNEPSGNALLGGDGSWSGFTQTNNFAVATGYVNNAADGYSSVQGTNNWSYQSYSGSAWGNLTYDSTNLRWGTSAAFVGEFNLLPPATNGTWVARTWTAPYAGKISIRGRVLKDDISGGSGVQAEITKNGTVIWPVSGTAQTVAYNDQMGYDTSLDTVSVNAGDVVRFQVNNAGAAANTGDTTSWMPTVAYTTMTNSGGVVTSVTPGTPRSDFSGYVGMNFTTGSLPLLVTSVGRWVAPGNSATHNVELVDASSGTVVGSAAVVTAGQPSGAFAYANLASPVTLSAAHTYYLLSAEVAGGDGWYDFDTSVSTTSAITVNSAEYQASGTYSPYSTAGHSYVPVSFIAATPVVSSASVSTSRNDFTGYVGFNFTTGSSALTVTSLGRWVSSGNTGTHTVEIVDAATGSVVATVSVATSGKPAGAFAYAALASPVVLTASHTYYLLSGETSGGDSWYDYETTVTTTGAITVNSAEYQASGTYSGYSTAGHAYVPVSFLYH